MAAAINMTPIGGSGSSRGSLRRSYTRTLVPAPSSLSTVASPPACLAAP